MTSDELKAIADGARDAIAMAGPDLAIVVIVAQPDPTASPFAVATTVTVAADVEQLLKAARIALVGS